MERTEIEIGTAEDNESTEEKASFGVVGVFGGDTLRCLRGMPYGVFGGKASVIRRECTDSHRDRAASGLIALFASFAASAMKNA
jgi:hypothetical protein